MHCRLTKMESKADGWVLGGQGSGSSPGYQATSAGSVGPAKGQAASICIAQKMSPPRAASVKTWVS